MFNFSHRWWLLKRRLVPPEEVAGLDITDSFCRLVLLDPATLNITAVSQVKIPPGTVVAGKVKSIANLVSALRQVRYDAGPGFSGHSVAVLSLPPPLFFTHVLELPDIPESSFEEAARLNAAQLSPIRFRDAYFDWQNLGVNLETFAREIYIAIAAKTDIDLYLEAARQAGIDIVAVEPSSLGLIRILTYFVTAADKRQIYLMIHVSSDGMDFVVVKEGKPLFNHFSFWRDISEIKDGRMTVSDFDKVTRQGIAKVSAFFLTRHKEFLSNAVIFTPIFRDELFAMLRDEFQMKVVGYRLPAHNSAPLSETWIGSLGSALRGIIARSEDVIVSVMPVGTEELFRRRQFRAFASFWGKALAAILLFFIFVFGGLFVFSANMEKDLLETIAVQKRSEIVGEMARLKLKAQEFNALVEALKYAESRDERWVEEMRILSAAAGLSVFYQTISISKGPPAVFAIRAISADRAEAIAFRDRLAASGSFEKIDIPIASIFDTTGGISFIVNATLKQ